MRGVVAQGPALLRVLAQRAAAAALEKVRELLPRLVLVDALGQRRREDAMWVGRRGFLREARVA